ncbi:MAG TPA: hypothetical protein VJI68_00385 [Candidatus Nanoarchaeia archaeon]|nr:hypothetical protein [Candidatus Nanoarchaeia archaeon]
MEYKTFLDGFKQVDPQFELYGSFVLSAVAYYEARVASSTASVAGAHDSIALNAETESCLRDLKIRTTAINEKLAAKELPAIPSSGEALDDLVADIRGHHTIHRKASNA